MAKKSFARYSSAEDLAQAIERWMAGQSDKAAQYDNLRLLGRELRAGFRAITDMLETNARFVSTLPPIQELIHVDSEAEIKIWRKRLATIFTGLLGAIKEFTAITYSEINGDQFQELVRVQRHRTELSKVRPIPSSRLHKGKVNSFSQQVISRHPDEVLISLICDPFCDEAGCDRPKLLAGIPIYDDTTEEPFGIILIACNLERIFEQQLAQHMGTREVLVLSDTRNVIMHYADNAMLDDHVNASVSEVAPHFADAAQALQTENEFIDETDREVYGARLWLIPRSHGLTYLLRTN